MKVSFIRERETKNTVRFKEKTSDQLPVIGILYIQKSAVKELGEPKKLQVTIEKAD